MALYYVQKFNFDVYPGGGSFFYGMVWPGDDKGAQFTVAATEYLTARGYKNIVAEDFKSNQTIPKTGICFVWNGKKWAKF